MKENTGMTLRIERKLPGPIERVWSYLVEAEKRALWFVGGEWELRPGGTANVEWDHRRLSDEPTPEEWKSFDGMTSTNTITRVEPPRLLAYRFDLGDGEAEVTFELIPQGKDVLLVLTQAPVSNDKAKADFTSGWLAYLGILEDRLNNVKPRGFWTYFNQMMAENSAKT
jgi:uncharacterized protein YndB with AHSA1/START domain